MKRLERHEWPGNVRELEHTIERACLVSDGPWLDLPDEPANAAGTATTDSQNLDAVERKHIEHVLASTGFRIAGSRGAAALLGLHPNTLRHRLKKLGIRRPS
jgi:DNA-binding NtrC family response regulator